MKIDLGRKSIDVFIIERGSDLEVPEHFFAKYNRVLKEYKQVQSYLQKLFQNKHF